MAETFSAAMRRYIGAGYKPTEAMRATWHDVKVGRAERPSRRGTAARRRAAKYPVLGLGLQARSNPRRRPPESRDRQSGRYSYHGQWDRLCRCGHRLGHHTAEPPHSCIAADFDASARGCRCERFRPKASDRRNPDPPGITTVSARGARQLLGRAPLPRRGYCRRLPDGRELCHDARGYYLVGARRNPAERPLRFWCPYCRKIHDTGAKHNPLIPGRQLSADQRRQVQGAFVHRGTAIGPGRYYKSDAEWIRTHAFHFTKGGQLSSRRFAEPEYGRKSLTRIAAEHKARLRRVARGVARRGNPELTGEQHQVLNHWARYGVQGWLRKVKSGWITDTPAALEGNFPTVFKRKRDGELALERLVLIRARQWRGLDPYGAPLPGDNPGDRPKAYQLVSVAGRRGGRLFSSKAVAQRAARSERRAGRGTFALRKIFSPSDLASWRNPVEGTIAGGTARIKVRNLDDLKREGLPLVARDLASRGFAAIAEVYSNQTPAAFQAYLTKRGRLVHVAGSRALFKRLEPNWRELVSAGQLHVTNPWGTFAGGTSAHHGYSYSHRSDAGEYHITPPQTRTDGYRLLWANTKRQPARHGGLWHDLGLFRSPQSAKGAAQRHAAELGVRLNPIYVQWTTHEFPERPRRRAALWSRSITPRKLQGAARFIQSKHDAGETPAKWYTTGRLPGEAAPAATYTTSSPAVRRFLHAWHESGRAHFERSAPSLHYDSYAPKTAKDRRRFIALDEGSSGRFLLDKSTGTVYSIKAYGVPNRRLGSIEEMTQQYEGGERDPRGRHLRIVRRNPRGLATRTVDMVERGRPVVRHTFYGATPAAAAQIERAHVRADRSLAAAIAGRPYRGVAIGIRRVGRSSSPRPRDRQGRALQRMLDFGAREARILRRNPPAQLTRFYDGITEIRGVKGKRFGFRSGTRFKHPFTSRPRAFGVDRAGSARLRRGDVVLRGRRPIYAQLGG